MLCTRFTLVAFHHFSNAVEFLLHENALFNDMLDISFSLFILDCFLEQLLLHGIHLVDHFLLNILNSAKHLAPRFL